MIYYDFHIHSALSPCGDKDMTPYNLVNMSKLLGLDIIALTDHNTCENCASAIKAGQSIGLTVIPGMELCTSEEVHVVCLFEELKAAEEFSDYVVFVGGSSSFDMAPKPYDKAYALDLYCKENGIAHDEIVYIGDDYGYGGNDESVFLADFQSIEIDDYTTLPEKVAVLLK